jgi:hypothetical protein
VPHRLLATSITSTTQNLPTAQSNINKLLAVNESTEILNGFIKFVFRYPLCLHNVLSLFSEV